jgi:hypothetical protein
MSTTTQRPRDSADKDTWDEYLKHGSDTVHLNKKPWAAKLAVSQCGGVKSGAFVHNISTPIHPIYHPRNWVLENFPLPQNNTWNLVEPALHIATKLITSSPALAFFCQLKYGHLTRQNERNVLSYTPPDDTINQDLAVLSDLHALSKRIKILFAALKPEAKHPSQTRAVHYVSQSSFGTDVVIRGDTSALPNRHDLRFQYIVVNEAYAAYAENANPSPAEAARFAFSLASTLVHETAHAFFARDSYNGIEEYDEPYFNTTQFKHGKKGGELGFAMEEVLFGTVLSQVVHPERGVHVEWEPAVSRVVEDELVVVESCLVFPVETEWMWRFARQEFWDGCGDGEDAMHVTKAWQGGAFDPRDGAGKIRWVVRRPDGLGLEDGDLLGRNRWYVEDYEGWDRRMLNEEVARLESEIAKGKWFMDGRSLDSGELVRLLEE